MLLFCGCCVSVAHHTGGVGVGGSNPLVPTKILKKCGRSAEGRTKISLPDTIIAAEHGLPRDSAWEIFVRPSAGRPHFFKNFGRPSRCPIELFARLQVAISGFEWRKSGAMNMAG